VGGAVCVLGPSRQQPQLVPGGVREPLGHPSLLGADRRDEGGVAQRKAPTHSLRFVVVVDQDRSAAFVDVEAVEVKAGDFTGASPGALEDLVSECRLLSGPLAQHPEAAMRRTAVGPGRCPQQVHVSVELGDDMSRQCSAALVIGDASRCVVAADGEGRRQS